MTGSFFDAPRRAASAPAGVDLVIEGLKARGMRSDPRSFDPAAADFTFRPGRLVDLWRVEAEVPPGLPTAAGPPVQFACVNLPMPYTSRYIYASVLFHVQLEMGAKLRELGLPKDLAVELYSIAEWNRDAVHTDDEARAAMRELVRSMCAGDLPLWPQTEREHKAWRLARTALTV